MKRALVAGVLLATGATPLAAQTGAGTESFDVAGIPVIYRQNLANQVIAVRLYIKGGAAALSASTQGIEQLMVSTAPLGTQKYDKARFTAIATSAGAEIKGEASSDFTVYSLRAVHEHWADSWDLFAQAVAHPMFPDSEFVLARTQEVAALKQQVDDPDSYLELMSDSVSYAGHPFHFRPSGTPESIPALTRDDVVRWHKRRLTKKNILIVAVGNVSRAELSARISESFASLPATGGTAPSVPALPVARPSLTIAQRSLPTNYIRADYVGTAGSSRDFAALQLTMRVLGQRLFEEVRTKRNLSYAPSAWVDFGLFSRGSIYVTAEEPDTTLKVIITEVRRLQHEAVSTEELRETLNPYVTGYWMREETAMSQARRLGMWELSGGGWRNASLIVDRMRQVTPADVQQVAQRYLRNARFVVVGDSAKIDRKLFTSL